MRRHRSLRSWRACSSASAWRPFYIAWRVQTTVVPFTWIWSSVPAPCDVSRPRSFPYGEERPGDPGHLTPPTPQSSTPSTSPVSRAAGLMGIASGCSKRTPHLPLHPLRLPSRGPVTSRACALCHSLLIHLSNSVRFTLPMACSLPVPPPHRIAQHPSPSFPDRTHSPRPPCCRTTTQPHRGQQRPCFVAFNNPSHHGHVLIFSTSGPPKGKLSPGAG